MLKQIKLLSFISVLMIGTVGNAAIDPFSYVKSLSKRPHDLGTMAVAAVLGNIAYAISEREYTDKGEYRTIGETEADPIVAEALYCAAAGTGLTAIENSLKDGSDNLSVQNRVVSSLINGICLFCTSYVEKQDIYKSLNRNHPLFRGWLPFNAKFDDMIKKAAVFGALRSAVQMAKDAVAA